MADKVINVRIPQKGDSTEAWNSSNLVLKNGEIGVETTVDGKKRIKFGNGTDTWDELPYFFDESLDSSTINCGSW